jgi:hypothetical protein
MTNSSEQIEKNVSASFAYVKKDMLMLNDAFSDIHDKVQHLSLNHAVLLEEIGKLRSEISRIVGKAEKATPAKKTKTTKKKKAVKKKPVKKKSAKKGVKKVVETKETVYS